MTSIGSRLRTAREQLGITNADAARRLHIRAMFVDSLEREQWETVGEPVYVRGFIRNYARLLHLDAAELVEAFNATPFVAERTVGATDADDPTERDGRAEARPLQRISAGPRFRYPLALGALSVVAFLLVVKVAWTMLTPGAVGHGEIRPAPAVAMTSTALPDERPETVALGAGSPTSGVDLRLSLTQSCWLSVNVDGKRVVYDTLPAGTIKEFHATREITLRAGNAGGVVATIDGQTLGTLGGPGQVQDRVFAVKAPPIGPSGTHE